MSPQTCALDVALYGSDGLLVRSLDQQSCKAILRADLGNVLDQGIMLHEGVTPDDVDDVLSGRALKFARDVQNKATVRRIRVTEDLHPQREAAQLATSRVYFEPLPCTPPNALPVAPFSTPYHPEMHMARPRKDFPARLTDWLGDDPRSFEIWFGELTDKGRQNIRSIVPTSRDLVYVAREEPICKEVAIAEWNKRLEAEGLYEKLPRSPIVQFSSAKTEMVMNRLGALVRRRSLGNSPVNDDAEFRDTGARKKERTPAPRRRCATQRVRPSEWWGPVRVLMEGGARKNHLLKSTSMPIRREHEYEEFYQDHREKRLLENFKLRWDTPKEVASSRVRVDGLFGCTNLKQRNDAWIKAITAPSVRECNALLAEIHGEPGRPRERSEGWGNAHVAVANDAMVWGSDLPGNTNELDEMGRALPLGLNLKQKFLLEEDGKLKVDSNAVKFHAANLMDENELYARYLRALGDHDAKIVRGHRKPSLEEQLADMRMAEEIANRYPFPFPDVTNGAEAQLKARLAQLRSVGLKPIQPATLLKKMDQPEHLATIRRYFLKEDDVRVLRAPKDSVATNARAATGRSKIAVLASYHKDVEWVFPIKGHRVPGSRPVRACQVGKGHGRKCRECREPQWSSRHRFDGGYYCFVCCPFCRARGVTEEQYSLAKKGHLVPPAPLTLRRTARRKEIDDVVVAIHRIPEHHSLIRQAEATPEPTARDGRPWAEVTKPKNPKCRDDPGFGVGWTVDHPKLGRGVVTRFRNCREDSQGRSVAVSKRYEEDTLIWIRFGNAEQEFFLSAVRPLLQVVTLLEGSVVDYSSRLGKKRRGVVTRVEENTVWIRYNYIRRLTRRRDGGISISVREAVERLELNRLGTSMKVVSFPIFVSSGLNSGPVYRTKVRPLLGDWLGFEAGWSDRPIPRGWCSAGWARDLVAERNIEDIVKAVERPWAGESEDRGRARFLHLEMNPYGGSRAYSPSVGRVFE